MRERWTAFLPIGRIFAKSANCAILLRLFHTGKACQSAPRHWHESRNRYALAVPFASSISTDLPQPRGDASGEAPKREISHAYFLVPTTRRMHRPGSVPARPAGLPKRLGWRTVLGSWRHGLCIGRRAHRAAPGSSSSSSWFVAPCTWGPARAPREIQDRRKHRFVPGATEASSLVSRCRRRRSWPCSSCSRSW